MGEPFDSVRESFFCLAQLAWDGAPITLQGAGASVQPGVGTVLKFPAGLDGAIKIQNGLAGRGGNSQIRDLVVEGSGTIPVSDENAELGIGAGLVIQANATKVSNVIVRQFEGNGCYVLSGLDNVVSGENANNCLFLGLQCRNNLQNGLAIAGFDSNACCIIKLDSTDNGQFGVYEHSILGNAYYSPHFSGNAAGPIRIGSRSGYNRFYAVYKEAGTALALQLDAPGSGQNYVDFMVAEGTGVDPANITITDNTLSENNIVVVKGTTSRGQFGGSAGATGTVSIQDLLLLLTNGGVLQLQDNPLTAIWQMFVHNGILQLVSASQNRMITNAIQSQGGVGMFNTNPPTNKPSVTGSRGNNDALTNLLAAVASFGMIADNTTA